MGLLLEKLSVREKRIQTPALSKKLSVVRCCFPTLTIGIGKPTLSKETVNQFQVSSANRGSCNLRLQSKDTTSHDFDTSSSPPPWLNAVLPHKRMAARQGFEPRLDVPKTSVLPLHHQA